MRMRMAGLLLAIGSLSSQAAADVRDPMVWLQPLSYQEMRTMWEKAGASARSQGEGRPRSGGDAPQHQGRDSGRRTQGLRRIYLRSGPYPPAAGRPGGPGAAAGSRLWLELPDRTVQAVAVKPGRSGLRGDYAMETGGWYRLFAFNDLGVRDGSRVKLYSLYNFMGHGDDPEEKQPDNQPRAGYVDGHPELELERVYAHGEERYRNYVGQTIRVRALFRRTPLAGARLALTTRQGWRQVRRTDERGEAEFALIKEDFSEGGVDRRASELYLLRLDHRLAGGGELDGAPYTDQRFVATLPFRVSAAKEDWQSGRLAYLVAMFAFVGSGTAIAVRRRRGRRS